MVHIDNSPQTIQPIYFHLSIQISMHRNLEKMKIETNRGNSAINLASIEGILLFKSIYVHSHASLFLFPCNRK